MSRDPKIGIALAVVGSRGFNNYPLLKRTIDKLRETTKVVRIVSGGARGADTLGERYAREHQIETLIYKPDWDRHGRRAGVLRNEDIVEAADLVLAFWDGKSPGTRNTIGRARLSKKLHAITYYK